MRSLLLVVALLSSTLAYADAVPPPPPCPKGKIAVSNHAGGACLDPAPTNCPSGWRGQVGGYCSVDVCTSNEQCGAGRECKPADICQEEYLQEWGWGVMPPPQQNQSIDPFLLGGPPQRFVPPRKMTRTIDICAADRTCPGTAKCEAAKVCMPKDAKKAGYWKAPAPKTK